MPKKQLAQLLWSRCVNTRGYQGTNIPADLHMEHLNRRLRTVLRNQGANITPKSVEKAGRSIGAVHHVCKLFEDQTSSSATSHSHPYPAFGRDYKAVLKVLREEVFTTRSNRSHTSFKFAKHLTQSFTKKQLINKTKKNINQIYMTVNHHSHTCSAHIHISIYNQLL